MQVFCAKSLWEKPMKQRSQALLLSFLHEGGFRVTTKIWSWTRKGRGSFCP